MLRMIFIQLWNERKMNMLIYLELVIVSVFLWYAADALFVNYKGYSRPLGFDISHVYHVELATVPQNSTDYDTSAVHNQCGAADFLTLRDRLAHHPKVEDVCFTSSVHFHYRFNNRFASFRQNSLIRNGYVRYVDPSYFRVFKVKTADGGPSEKLEQALRENRVVVTSTVADYFFGSASNAQNQEIQITDQGAQDSVFYRIGAVSEPQRYSEFHEYSCAYYKPIGPDEAFLQSSVQVVNGLRLFIRVKSDADNDRFVADFTREMLQQLRLGNIYLKEVVPMSYYRDEMLRSWVDNVRMYFSGILFFLLNVFLGIIGTFWFRTQQRSAEIGLRMAMGASRRNIFRHLFAEGFVLLGVAFVPAVFIFANLMYLEVTEQSEMQIPMLGRLLCGMGMTFGMIAIMVAVGIGFPAFRAMRLQPVDTLHDE